MKGKVVIDEELEIFSGVKGTRLNPSGNQALFIKDGESFKLDDFSHEQNLIMEDFIYTIDLLTNMRTPAW